MTDDTLRPMLATTTQVSNVSVVTLLSDLSVSEWKQLCAQILDRSQTSRSQGTVLDLSAIHCMDATDMKQLQHLLKVAMLMGHPVVVTELKPAVVATLVQFGFHLSSDRVYASVEEGVASLQGEKTA